MISPNNRPLIGITCDYLAPKGRNSYTAIQSGYYDAILTAGGLPILLPPLPKEQDIQPLLDKLDGVILTEGDDMDPKKMGLGPHPSIKTTPDRRENADRMVCKLAQQRKLPMLGIGLGLQVMNVVYGGGIYQHLPEDMPRSIPHRDPQGGAHRHSVIMEKGSMMEEIYGEGEIRVNSFHHQGIRKVAPGFRAAAVAPDGLVEAIEWKGEDWFCVGVQWHPQNDGQISLDSQLIEAFVSAAGKAAAPSIKKSTLSLAKAG